MPAFHPDLRMLLVGTDASWRSLVERCAAQVGARLDVVADVPAAIAWMLDPGHVYDHVLASAPLGSLAIDTLAGMLDEVTLCPTPLLLLGFTTTHGGQAAIRCLQDKNFDELCAAVRHRPVPEMPGSPLTPAELVTALHGGALRMRFQPILRASDLAPIGLEALARIHTRARGILHPRDFIPATLACGREGVLTGIAAARTLVEISRQLGDGCLFVSLNLPIATVLRESAMMRGVELCAVAGISPSRILIEVLESPTSPDLGELGAALTAWRSQGFKTAIDDAGPELPHWRELLELPFDVVKIDGALVADPKGIGLMERIVDAAKARDRFVIAEGIADEACLDCAGRLQVDAYQGFLFSRPLPSMAVPVWLDQHVRQRVVLAA